MPLPLRTARLVVRPPLPEDAPALAAFQRENAERLAPWSPPRPEGFHTEAWWVRRAEQVRQEHEAGTAIRLTLWDAQRALVGHANLTRIAMGPFCAASLGYEIGARHEGQGLMYEALEAVLATLFAEVDLHRIEANHLPENHRSASLLKRLGFEIQGYARDYLYIGGAWRDHVLTAKTNPRPFTPKG